MDYVKMKLYSLFEQYKDKSTSEASSSSADTCQHDSSVERKRKGWSVYDEFIAYERQIAAENGLSSLDVYLQEGKLVMKYFPELDVLQYWKNKKDRYGDLASIACDALCIPITILASDICF